LLFRQIFKLSKHISQALLEVLMITAKQLRSRMRRKVHVRFWSRAAGATPSLRLTIKWRNAEFLVSWTPLFVSLTHLLGKDLRRWFWHVFWDDSTFSVLHTHL